MPDISFNLTGLEKIKTLIELLNKHRDVLPGELVDGLKELANTDGLELGSQWFCKARANIITDYGNGNAEGFDFSFVADGEEIKIVSINTILRKITTESVISNARGLVDSIVYNELYPKHFVAKCGDHVLVEFTA